MAYFPDLSPYTYLPDSFDAAIDPNLLNVGWLDSSAPYIQGEVDTHLANKLVKLCRKPVKLMRGLHSCQFCERGKTVGGNGEIRVSGENGIVYAAPNLIYHYIVKHGYRPPDEFLAALEKLAL